MPKKKTHKATDKRIRETKNGKLLYVKAGKRHLLTKKSSRQKRRKSGFGEIAKPDRKRVKRLIST